MLIYRAFAMAPRPHDGATHAAAPTPFVLLQACRADAAFSDAKCCLRHGVGKNAFSLLDY